MNRQHRRRLVLTLALIVAWGLLFGPTPAMGQDTAPSVGADLKERDSLWESSKRYRVEGKTAEAIAAAEAILAIERRVLGAEHDDVAGSLDWLAGLYGEHEDFAAARRARQEILALVKKRYGEDSWKMHDARLRLADLERLSRMDRPQRQRLAEADRLNRQVIDLYEAGKGRGAIPLARQALAIRHEVLSEPHLDYAYSLNILGLLLEEQGDYAAARPLFEQARAIWKKLLGEKHPYYAASLENIAKLLNAQGDYAAARPLFEQARDITKEVVGEHHSDYATSLNNLAEFLREQGDYAAARPLYEQARDIQKEVLGVHHSDYAISLNNLAELLREQGDYAAARPLYEQARDIKKDVLGEHHPSYAISLNTLALLLREQGDYASARPLFEQARGIFKVAYGERHPLYAASLDNLATVLQEQGDYAAARPLYEQARDIRKEVLGVHHSDYATSLNNLAELLHEQGDYASARPLLEQARDIFKVAYGERHPLYAASLDNLATVLQEQGDYAAARPLYEQAQDIRKQVVGELHPDYARGLNNLAGLLRAQGDYAAARPLYEQARDIFRSIYGVHHPVYAASLENLAHLLQDQRDYAAARPLFEQALAIARQNLDLAADVQSERQQLAMALMLRRHLDNYVSLALTTPIPSDAIYGHVLAWKGAVLQRQRRMHALRRIVRQDQRPEVVRLADDLQDTATRLATLALATPDPRQLDAWRRQIAELTGRKEHLEGELARRSAAFRGELGRRETTPRQLQAVLPAASALVDFLEYSHREPSSRAKGSWRQERRLAAFIVRPDQPVIRLDLDAIEPIAVATRRWCKTYGAGLAPGDDDPAATLRRLVWAPVEPHLKGSTTVLVSPDGVLAELPLAALPGREKGTYLIEERAIALVPVPQSLPELLESAGHPPAEAVGLLAVGDVDYGASPGAASPDGSSRVAASRTRRGTWSHFNPLTATRGEILAVCDSFELGQPGTRPCLLRGGQATEEAFRRQAGRHRFLHLATHGYFASSTSELHSALAPETTGPRGMNGLANPGIDPFGGKGVIGFHPGLLSGIALAGANRDPEPGQDDGILTALEVAELDLSGVELAVLAGCETGLGQEAVGEGLLGLQRAFQEAGARTVVATLWAVGDDPARALMERFYENLWQKHLGKLEALREAQLWMLREGRARGLVPVDEEQSAGGGSNRVPPRVWAAFVLSGDWR